MGAGLGGCFLAVELRRRGYGEVLLLERLPETCGVGPRVVTEIHAGGEYPFDLRSAVDCLHGLAAIQRVLPAEAVTKPRTHMLIAAGSAAAGLDGQRYAALLRHLQIEYEQMVRQDPSLEQDICPVGEFWRRLDPDEYADVVNVDCGFVTPQRGVQPDVLVSTITRMLHRTGVDVRVGHNVRRVVRRGRGQFRVEAVTEAGERTFDSSQVAFANHVRGFALARGVADDGFAPDRVHVALRLIADVEYRQPRPFPAPTRLMLEGEFGAMDAPLGAGHGLVYHPPLSHLELTELSPQYSVPADWLDRVAQPAEADTDRARHLVARAAEIAYPVLRDAVVRQPRIAIAVNSVADSRVRRNMGVRIPSRDCVSLAFTTKATTTALNAARAADHLTADARRRHAGPLSGGGRRSR
ncbi:NAD(P)-binding protein [Streptomyces sp. MAR4 CNX-425]|uniref:NAD(P)-binding protein n=1 Tax=Streptomyces sp. MAR4 CNX-425 TaxID=3406343 RepID=UPI003B4FFC22